MDYHLTPIKHAPSLHFNSTFLFFNTEFEDFLVTSAPPIYFPSGSRLGDIYCGVAIILNDDIAEPLEEFSVNVVSRDEEVAVVIDSVLTVFIEDDDGMMTCYIYISPIFWSVIHACIYHKFQGGARQA